MFVLEQVSADRVDEVWDDVVKRWEGKEYLWDHYETLEFVKHTIEAGLRMLWRLRRDEEVVMTMVTQFVPRQTARVFQIILCEGDDVEYALTLIEAIERLAAQAGCEWVEVHGRAGWCRLLKEQGYFEAYRVCSKRTNFHQVEGNA